MLPYVLPSGLVPDPSLPGLPAGPPLILLRYHHVRHALQADGPRQGQISSKVVQTTRVRAFNVLRERKTLLQNYEAILTVINGTQKCFQ